MSFLLLSSSEMTFLYIIGTLKGVVGGKTAGGGVSVVLTSSIFFVTSGLTVVDFCFSGSFSSSCSSGSWKPAGSLTRN